MFGNISKINKPWKDKDGRFNVIVQFEEFDSMQSLQSRAQRFIAFEGVRDSQWPNVPVLLIDRPSDLLYHYREQILETV